MRRITILLAALAALMLVPAVAAQAYVNIYGGNLKLNITGTGSGEVTSLGPGSGEYALSGNPAMACVHNGIGTTVCENEPEETEEEEEFYGEILTAHPAEGSELAGWTVQKAGYSFCVSEECTVASGEPGEEEFEATAVFCTAGTAAEGEAACVEGGPAGPPLTLDIEEGEGTVVSNPAGIECTGSEGESCTTEEIAEGQVTLTASPAAGYRFKSWKGCDKKNLPVTGNGVNGRQCTITLNGERSVSAKFVKTWNVTIENGGNGKVSTKPGGALCLPNCSEVTASFDEGKNVEVLSKPNKHFHFVEFGGDCSGSSCTLASISADHTVSATFAEDTKYALSLAKEGGGQALIKTKPPGMVCSYTCGQLSASFYEGEVIEVKWKLGKGTSSIDWSTGAGTCTGTSEAVEGTCTVTMSAARELVADLG